MNYLGPNGDLDVGSCLMTKLETGVLTIALNRLEQHNAINTDMSLALQRLLTAVSRDDTVRVVVVRGNGPSFCVGLENAEFLDATLAAEQLLRNLALPVIAMVHGKCHGGAMALIEACDIVFASDETEFSLTEQAYDGTAAQPMGLVTLSMPDSALEVETYQLARDLADKDSLALRFTKEALSRVADIPWDEVLSYTMTQQSELKSLQAGRPSARALAVESFLAGKSKPGTGG